MLFFDLIITQRLHKSLRLFSVFSSIRYSASLSSSSSSSCWFWRPIASSVITVFLSLPFEHRCQDVGFAYLLTWISLFTVSDIPPHGILCPQAQLLITPISGNPQHYRVAMAAIPKRLNLLCLIPVIAVENHLSPIPWWMQYMVLWQRAEEIEAGKGKQCMKENAGVWLIVWYGDVTNRFQGQVCQAAE